MSSISLHPLARQSLVASTIPACTGWAFGMMKYLAHEDPRECVNWAFEIVRPYLDDNCKHSSVFARSRQHLRDVLDDPVAADLKQMEEFVWEPWNHYSPPCNGRPMARLIWAAMGVVVIATPGKASQLSESRMFPRDEDHNEIAKRLVWDQSATAIHMIAHDQPDVLQATAEVFTKTVCFSERPGNSDIESRVEWSWNEIIYEIGTLRRASNEFYFEFTDRTVDEKLFSGPFSSMGDVDDHMELLKHQPKKVRLVPKEPRGTG